MANYLIWTVLTYLYNQNYLSARLANRLLDETMEELRLINQHISPQLQALFDCLQNPHQLSYEEKRHLMMSLVAFVGTLENNPAFDGFDIQKVYGIFCRETNGVIDAFRRRELSDEVVIKKVFFLSLLLSSVHIQDENNIVQIYRRIVEVMIIDDATLRPLLSLLQDGERPSADLLMTIYQQIYHPETMAVG